MQKRMNMRYLLLWAVLACLFSSCIEDIDLNHIRPDAKLVLNCATVPEQPVSAYLSRTWFYVDGKPNLGIEGAEVQLYVNDVFQEKMALSEDTIQQLGSRYLSEYRPRVGDRLKIVASAKDYTHIEAVTELPELPQVTNVSISHKHKVDSNLSNVEQFQCHDEFQLTFHDDPAVDNYYLIYARDTYLYIHEGDTTYRWNNSYLDFGNEPLFANQVSAIDRVLENNGIGYFGGMAFSDELVKGKTYTLNVKGSTSSYSYYGTGYGEIENLPHERIYQISFCSISRSYYNYLKTLADYRNSSFTGDLASVGLAEPIKVYSNVAGGTGFLGAATCETFELRGK